MRFVALYSNVTSTGTKALKQVPTFNEKKYYYSEHTIQLKPSNSLLTPKLVIEDYQQNLN